MSSHMPPMCLLLLHLEGSPAMPFPTFELVAHAPTLEDSPLTMSSPLLFHKDQVPICPKHKGIIPVYG